MNNNSNNRNNIVGGEEECNNIGLELGLGMMGAYHYSSPPPSPPPPTDHNHKKRWSSRKEEEEKSVVRLDLSFTLCPKQEEEEEEEEGFRYESMSVDHEEQEMLMNKNNIKSSITTSSGRGKKLRLTKDQSSLLEHTFKLHSTLNPAEKQALAEQLNLKPRQVEVWFQNRRARTKLKQTEVDCEFLKKCCEKLSNENKRLKKELQELRAVKIGRSGLHHVHFAKDTTTRAVCCSSCERSKC